MKLIVTLLALLASTNLYAWNQRAPNPIEQCQIHSPYGFPQTKTQIQPICRQGYLVGYDAQAKIPKFVTYELSPQNALGCIARSNAFTADQSIKNGPKPDDYTGTGYDKGHASPDGDQSWDQQVEYESFLMTNMFPQHGSLNRGIWKLLETSIRGWSSQLNNNFTIYIGAVYTDQNKKIGSGVVVPHGFYKIVINNNTKEIAGWAFPHQPPYPNLGNDLTRYRLPIAQIQQAAGVTYAFPNGSIEVQPGQEWKVDFGDLTNSKRKKCGVNSSAD
jgi:endonuclease G